mgnify:CR=1 FL=1
MNVLDLKEIETAPDSSFWDSDRGELRFMVRIDDCHVPVLVRSKNECNDTLLVTYNGAIQRSKAPDGVVFQRSSWLDDFQSSVIQIADPTMVKHDRLQLGWGQFTKENWAIEGIVGILEALRNRFGFVGAENTLHYGSSAGGFQAICCATLDRGSIALVNNPQLDWSFYSERYVEALLRDVFEGSTLEDIKANSPWRVSVVDFFECVGYVPETEVLLNVASAGDFERQLKPALSKLETVRSLGKKPALSFNLYHDENLGHNPLGKPYTIEKINSKLYDIRSSKSE